MPSPTSNHENTSIRSPALFHDSCRCIEDVFLRDPDLVRFLELVGQNVEKKLRVRVRVNVSVRIKVQKLSNLRIIGQVSVLEEIIKGSGVRLANEADHQRETTNMSNHKAVRAVDIERLSFARRRAAGSRVPD